MKHNFLILSLLACIATGIVAQTDVNKSCSFSSCCKDKKCAPKPISKPTTITKSGCYCLTQDICGQITIAADNVTLDLNCHEVNGNGADAAIAADGYYNVTVKNGTVSNFLVVKSRGVGIAPNRYGVAISNGIDIELHDLNIISTDPVGMALTNCVGINISGCDFSGNDQALLLSGCRNGKISCCAAYDNVNTNEELTTSAVVGCEFCDCIEFADVDVCNNTKNVPTGGFDPRAGIFTAAFSSNVSLERCKVNGSGTDLPFIFINNVYFFASNNCTVTDCQANNNSIQDGQIAGISALFTPGCAIRTSQANGNTANEELFNAPAGILLFGSPNFVIKDCQANDTFGGQTDGIANILSDDGQIVNCQANNNNGSGVVIGIVGVSSNNTSITGCQANNNSSSETVGLGISTLNNVGTIIENCEANNNSSGAASNTPFFAAGIEIDSFTASKDIRIINCVANGTRSTVDAFGILLVEGFGGATASNVVIKCCQCCDIVNSSTVSSSVAGGIGVRGGNDVSIQDCQVYDARAAGNGSAAGILVENTVRCTIEGSEAFNSTAANSVGDGIILKGSTNNSTVRDCATIGNQDSGFADIGANDNFFAGNYAEANGTDYNGVTTVAVVFNKSAGSFSATPNRWSNIQAVI